MVESMDECALLLSLCSEVGQCCEARIAPRCRPHRRLVVQAYSLAMIASLVCPSAWVFPERTPRAGRSLASILLLREARRMAMTI